MASPKLIFGAVFLHLIFLASVFDIYFQSPVLKVEKSHAPRYDAPARRLVLFVADGLRAETFFQHDERGNPLAPFLRDVIEQHGSYGVSHTRVPTESRPGHVALIAGMYEDPSAITKGWKENPVDFDTVFNQSGRTYGWGSPDILPMFSKGVTGNRMQAEMYAPEEEDFFGKSELDKLDTWVFDKVEKFFSDAYEDTGRQMELREDKLVLFLHLLGCDSNGHANRPYSREYKNNIRVVDEGIRRVTELVETYWRHDDRTAFVFTSDHGMTDWGSHGTGMRHETEVPMVAWGAGVRHPENRTEPDLLNDVSWRLGNLKRVDVKQADIAPLMSALIGAGVPKNSVGKLPKDYLKMSPVDTVEASQTVTKQVYEMLRTAQDGFESYYHTPYPKLDEKKFREGCERVERLVKIGKNEEALKLSEELYEEALEGVEYYRKYYRLNLYLAISVTYIGFILWTGMSVLQAHSPLFSNEATTSNGKTRLLFNAATAFGILGAATATALQNIPFHYVIYYSAPVIVWRLLLSKTVSLKFVSIKGGDWARGAIGSILAVTVVEFMVMAFFDRVKLSAAIAIITVWQIWNHRKGSAWMNFAFAVLNTCLSFFTFQPSIGKERNDQLVLYASGLSGIGFLLLLRVLLEKRTSGKVDGTLIAFLFASGVCVWLSSSFQLSPTVRSLVQVVAWVIFATGVPLSLTREARALPRLLHVCMALQASYILLSLSYEGLFQLFLIASLFLWLLMEYSDSYQHQRLDKMSLRAGRERNVVNWRDVLRSLQFVFYTLVSFFGTGNIASLNSFDPRSIQCLVSVFNPFLMGGILLLKVLIPFLLVSCFMYVIKHFTQMHSRALFFLIMLFSDIMSLHFFFLVTDEGSWLDIGTSLSHFVIAEATVIFLIVLLSLAGAILKFTTVRRNNKESEDDMDVYIPKVEKLQN